MIIESVDGITRIDCMHCGKMYPAPAGFEEDAEMRRLYTTIRICEECTARAEEKKKAMAEEERRSALRRSLGRRAKAAGIPEGYSHDKSTGAFFQTPPLPYVADFIAANWKGNLLISGETGSGKSTSACHVACRLLSSRECHVRYAALRELLAEWREVKTSDRQSAVEKFLRGLYKLDLLIIDEVVGKSRITEAGQEFLFELLEAVNSGRCRTVIWLLGNFYTGSIEEIFSDPEPVRRRLQENFLCVLADRRTKTIKPITVWSEK